MSFINMYYKQGTSNINKQLEKAINERKCDEVKVLLSAGADINHTVNQNLDTMLHIAKSPAIARDLLGYSANINAKNLYNKLPLHSAVENAKCLEFIKTLLDHGAHIDAKDSKGRTALNYGVKKSSVNLEVVKELILKGADVNNLKTQHLVYDSSITPLDDAILVDDQECVKVMIKYSLLTKYHENSLDLSNHYLCASYPIFLSYIKECQNEFCLMRQEMLNDNTSLYQVIFNKYVCRQELYKNEKELKLFTEKSLMVVMSHSYHIYHDVITQKLIRKLEKPCLVEKLSLMQIYTLSGQKKIVLGPDITNILAKYSSKNDLFNLVQAFYNQNVDEDMITTSCRFVARVIKIRKLHLLKRPCEPSTSDGSNAKKLKLFN